jgi:hypothetical protein
MQIDPDGIYNEQELADYRRCSVSKVQKDRLKGTGPRFFKSGHLVRYRGRDILDDINARIRSSTSDLGQKAAEAAHHG